MSTTLEGVERAFSVREVAAHLGFRDVNTIYTLIADGRIRHVRAGRAIRIPESALREFLAGE
jgi:excisionase family DNA binding protein